jgi:SAM-dependent methyltransferase
MAERGLTVLGLEPDERMAAIARGHGVQVEIGAFEDWDAAGRVFDLITFADSWHFIDPLAGVPRAAELLRPGGAVARFWNQYTLDPEVLDALDPIYRRHAPDLVGSYHPGAGSARRDPTASRFEQSGRFAPVQMHSYKSVAVITADEWVARVATTSDHRRLGDRLAPLLSEVRTATEGLGGTMRVHRTTFLALSRRL